MSEPLYSGIDMKKKSLKQYAKMVVTFSGSVFIILMTTPFLYQLMKTYGWISPIFKATFVITLWLFGHQYVQKQLGRKLSPAEMKRYALRRLCFLICVLILLLATFIERA